MRVYLLLLPILFVSCCTYRYDAADPLALTSKNPQTKAKIKKKPIRKNVQEIAKQKTRLPQKKSTLNLADVIDLGLQNNPNTTISWAEARAAASVYGQSLADFYPEIDIFGNYQRVKENLQEANLHINYYQTTITPEMQVNYLIFDFGERRYNSQSALYALNFANYSFNQQLQSVLQGLINDYFDYLYQKEALEADQADLLTAKATLDAAEEKKRTGVASLSDIVQAKTQYLQIKMSLIAQRVDTEASYAQLATQMGIPANFPFKTANLPLEIETDVPIQNLRTLIDTAKKCRQDFLAVKANRQSKAFAVDSAIAKNRPIITANFDLGKDFYGSMGSKEDYHWTLQFTLGYPLFKGFYYDNLIKQSKANLKEAEAQVKQSELNVIEEVSVAHFDVKMAKQTYETAKDYLETATLRFKIALANYKAGANTILDVLSAQSSLADARAEMASAKKTWFLSLANLAYATGTLTKNTLSMKEEI